MKVVNTLYEPKKRGAHQLLQFVGAILFARDWLANTSA